MLNVFLLVMFQLLLLLRICEAVLGNFATQCFLPTYHRGISNADPIAEIWRVDAIDCLTYCIVNAPKSGDGCSSVVYHRHFSTCQLYGHDGTLNGAQIVYASGHDYYNRTSYVGECRDRQKPKRGYQREQLKTQQQARVQQFVDALAQPKSGREFRRHESRKEPRRKEQHPFSSSEKEPESGMEVMSKQPVTAFLNQNLAFATCPPEEIIGYIIFVGYESTAKARPRRLYGIDQAACSAYCTMNIDAGGDYFPCISINYYPTDELCHLYGTEMKTKNGIAHIIRNDKNIYADKICLPVAKQFKHSCHQETMFIIHPNRKITKRITDHSNGTVSIGHCIAICVNNFYCQSVTYKNGLCMLHDVNVANDQQAMTGADHDTYVIENGCITSVPPQHEVAKGNVETTWSEWSDCQFGVNGERVRVRSRDCGKAKCTDLQVQNCS